MTEEERKVEAQEEEEEEERTKAKTNTKKEILENEPFGSLTLTICCKTLWQLSCNEENRFFLMAYAI